MSNSINSKVYSLIRSIVLISALVSTPFAFAGDPPVNVDQSTAGHPGGPAISGFDPVAYFTMSKPIPGTADFSHEHDGATWQFSSAENLELFKAAPDKYAPQYGGYCAYAVSKGKTAPIDPLAWRIVDDKLYLNYNKSIQDRWAKDVAQSIVDGDANWPKVLN